MIRTIGTIFKFGFKICISATLFISEFITSFNRSLIVTHSIERVTLYLFHAFLCYLYDEKNVIQRIK